MKNNSEIQPYEPQYASQKAPHCGAKLRNKDQFCKLPAIRGKKRCRLHGGAPNSGAPIGNQNALKHGYYTAEKQATFNAAKQLLSRLLL